MWGRFGGADSDIVTRMSTAYYFSYETLIIRALTKRPVSYVSGYEFFISKLRSGWLPQSRKSCVSHGACNDHNVWVVIILSWVALLLTLPLYCLPRALGGI